MAAQNLANTKQDLIGALVQRELINSASLTMFVDDLSALAGKGVKSISVPKLSSFTVQDRAFGAASTENAPLTDSVDTIDLNKNKIVLYGYDAADALQSTINYQQAAATRAASAHGRQVNADIVAMWAAVAGTALDTGATVTAADILDMREAMLLSDADMSKVAIVCAPDQEKIMLKLPEFSRYEYRGEVSALVTGQIGTIYGIPVFINNAIPAKKVYMVEKTGSAIAFQRLPKYQEQDELDYGTEGKKVAVDQTYGLGGMQLGEGVAAAGKSPFVAEFTDSTV